MAGKKWKCNVCGYVHEGDKPPKECPQCSSSSKEFDIFREKKKLSYDGKKFDVLLINGSSHRSHNTHILVDYAESALKRKGASYRRFNLNELNVNHCWCCYSMKDEACTYPCRDQLDDAPSLHEMILNCKAIIVASPINWNNMSARLKDFLDRLTCIQNQCLLGKGSPCAGKVVGVLINGHEDGAMKTAADIFLYFEQMGFVLAPYGFMYRTHGAAYDAKEDNGFLSRDALAKRSVEGVVNNVVLLMKQGLEKKIKGKIIGVCE